MPGMEHCLVVWNMLGCFNNHQLGDPGEFHIFPYTICFIHMHKMVVPKNGWLLYEYLWFIYGESTTNWEPQGSHRLLDLAMDGLKGINWTCVEMCPINGGFHSHGGTPQWKVYKGTSH